jgi:choline kinase
MVPYQGVPVIERLLRTMRECGVTDITLATGYRHDALQYLGLRTLHNPAFASTNMVYTMFCAESALVSDTVISYSDILYSSSVLRTLLNSDDDVSVVVDTRWRELWERRMSDPLSDAETMKVSPQGYIQELGRTPKSLDEIEGQYIGLFKISAHALKKVSSFYHALDRNSSYGGRSLEQMHMTTFIQLVIDNLMPVKAVMVAGGWLEIDTLTDLTCSPVGNGCLYP